MVVKMFCVKCGKALYEGDVFCQSCGTKVLTNLEKEVPIEVAESKTVMPEVVQVSEEVSVEVAPKAVSVVEESLASPDGKKKCKKIVVFTIIFLLVVAIAVATVWAKENLSKCVGCGRIVYTNTMQTIFSPTCLGFVRCASCATGYSYGGEGFSFYTDIEFVSDGYETGDNYRFYEWKTEDGRTEVEVMVGNFPNDISEEESNSFYKECVVDMYGDEVLEYWDIGSMFGYDMYVNKESSYTIIARDYCHMYIFKIFSDNQDYVDSLYSSIIYADNY